MGSEMHASSSCSELNVPLEVSSTLADRGSIDSAKYDNDEGKTEQDAVSYNTEEGNSEPGHSKQS